MGSHALSKNAIVFRKTNKIWNFCTLAVMLFTLSVFNETSMAAYIEQCGYHYAEQVSQFPLFVDILCYTTSQAAAVSCNGVMKNKPKRFLQNELCVVMYDGGAIAITAVVVVAVVFTCVLYEARRFGTM